MNKRKGAVAIGITTAFLYGLMSIFSRWMDSGFAPMTQVYLRVIGAAILGSLLFYREIDWKKYLRLSFKEWVVLLGMGVGGYGLMVYAITQGALQTSLLNVSVVFSTVPFFVYLLSALIFRKSVSYGVFMLLAVSVWGVGVLASGSVIPAISRFGRGDWWVLLATVMEALWFIGIKIMSRKLTAREIAVAAQIIAGIVVLGAARYSGEPMPIASSFTDTLALMGLVGGIVVNILTPIMTVYMFRHLDEVFATQLLLFENIFSLLIGWVFYGEARNSVHILGAVLVVGAVYLMNKRATEV